MKNFDGYTKVILTGIFILLGLIVIDYQPTKQAVASWGNKGATEMIVQVAGTNDKIWHVRNGKIRLCAIFSPLIWLDHFVSCGKWDVSNSSK